MAVITKGSRKAVLLALLILPLGCIFFLVWNISCHSNSWRFPYPAFPISLPFRSEGSLMHGGAFMRFSIRRLVRGQDRRALSQNGISCISDPQSNMCVTSDSVRITTASNSLSLYLTAGQHLLAADRDRFAAVKPYPRKNDAYAMQRTSRVSIVHVDSYGSGGEGVPACDVVHSVPAVVFSTGGFAGNFFHDVNDVILPLFLTAGHFRTRVQLVVTDYEPWWIQKYQKFFNHLSAHNIIAASSNSTTVSPAAVHCFPGAVLGLKVHGYLHCNSTLPPGGTSALDFKQFLREAYSLSNAHVRTTDGSERPVLLLLSRLRSRALLNERDVVALAEEIGFTVKVATPEMTKHTGSFSEMVNGCGVLMGVHGAGLTHMMFLPAGAVVVQIVPWGLDWVSDTYFGRERTAGFGLNYVGYKAAAEESTLYSDYPKSHPVISNPLAIHQQGFDVSKPIFYDGQNVTIDISRFRRNLLEARNLLPPRDSSSKRSGEE